MIKGWPAVKRVLKVSVLALPGLLSLHGCDSSINEDRDSDSNIRLDAGIQAGTEFKKGELLVKWKSSTTTASKTSTDSQAYDIRKTYGIKNSRKLLRGKIQNNNKSAEISRWEIIELEPGQKEADVLQRLRTDSRVESIEYNYRVKANLIPNDTSFGQLWGMHNTGQSGGQLDADIDAVEAQRRCLRQG